MLKRLAAFGLMCTLAFTAVASAPQPAEARRGGGIGLGIAGGLIAGAIIGGAAYGYPRYYGYSRYDTDGGCYPGPRVCRRVGGSCYENRFGDTVCRGGDVRCYRRTVCD